MPRLLSLLASLLLALPSAWLTGCRTNPVSGREEIVLMSEEDEQEIGDQAARQVSAELGIVDDPALSAYIEQLGRRLAQFSPRQDLDYSFQIVEMEEPNAFALPGGYIYVSRGLLALANSEAEVANVLAHEIGHVAARHAAQRDTAAKAATLLTLLGVAAAAASSGDGRSVAGMQFLGQGLLASYSRGQERQSDRIAIELTTAAGIDPGGMARFLKQLDNSTRLQTGASRAPGFFDTHPATRERFAEATTRAQVAQLRDPDRAPSEDERPLRLKTAPGPVIDRSFVPAGATDPSPDFAIAPTQREFFDRIDGLVVGPAAREGVFRENIFLHADLGISLRFPPGWVYQNMSSQVIAVAPDGDAIARLELAGDGDDPRAAAAEFADREGVTLSAGTPIRIGGLRAFRANAVIQAGGARADALVTWVAYDGRVYQLAAGTLDSSFPKYDGILRSFARGFRPLTPEQRQEIDELRLRIAVARPGETLARLSKRTENEWNLNETAVSNALFVEEVLAGGQLVKIARREPYVAPPAPPPEDAPAEAPVQGPAPP
jgi:predicted Zn-dependent protease